MKNLKQLLLVSGFLIALILPYVEAGMLITRGWEWVEQQIAKYGNKSCQVQVDSRCVASLDEAMRDAKPGSVIVLSAGIYPTVWGSNQIYSNVINNCATGGAPCSQYGIHSDRSAPDAVNASPDDWPNAKDCPFDKDKGVNVCK